MWLGIELDVAIIQDEWAGAYIDFAGSSSMDEHYVFMLPYKLCKSASGRL